ncbi:PAS domain S-box protein [bacterium]|nr:PAS domain S-box protein [bacterium]
MKRIPLRIPNLQSTGALPHVLIVTPDDDARDLLSRQLEAVDSIQIVCAKTAPEAIKYLSERSPAVLLCDVSLPDLDGFQISRLLKLPFRPGTELTPVVLFSGSYRDVLAEHVARKAGAFAFLKLPGDARLVARTIELALHRLLASPADCQLLTHKGIVQVACSDDSLAHLIVSSAEQDGWRTQRGMSLPEIAKSWSEVEPQVVLFELPRNGKTEIPVSLLSELEEPPALIALLRRTESDGLLELMMQGVDDFLVLPAQPPQIVTAIRDARLKFNFRSMHGQFEQQFEKLREIGDYLDLVITNSHEAIFTCDTEGRVRLWNKGAERVYGFTADEIIGMNIDEYLDPPGFTRKSPHVVRLLEQRGSMTDPEVERMRKSGEIFPVTATYTLLRDAHGKVLGFSVIERDVTPIKALENEKIKSARLRAITQTAVTANDHINTPLGIILGYAQFLEMKLANVDQQDRAALEVIQQQVHKIKGIMNKLKLISDPIVKNYSIEGVTMLDLTKSQLTNEATI